MKVDPYMNILNQIHDVFIDVGNELVEFIIICHFILLIQIEVINLI